MYKPSSAPLALSSSTTPRSAEASTRDTSSGVPPSSPIAFFSDVRSNALFVLFESVDAVHPSPTRPASSIILITNFSPMAPLTTTAQGSRRLSRLGVVAGPVGTIFASFASSVGSDVRHTKSPASTRSKSIWFAPNVTEYSPMVTAPSFAPPTEAPLWSKISYTRPPSSRSSGAPRSITTPSPRFIPTESLFMRIVNEPCDLRPGCCTRVTSPSKTPRWRGARPRTRR
mmetsp:Transcript_1863/g.4252  ORF Transcript_1863/g.4252 Transcript_1863/m.4252 type:complete len:228 (-) Transcript_1863:1210-1893(-)